MSTVHASACVIGRHGVLVRGPSGAGKSLLVHMLIEAAHGRGHFGIWLADDQIALDAQGSALLARPVSTIGGRAELRFYGIMPVSHAAVARIDVVVDLTEIAERLPETDTVLVETIPLPCIKVPRNDLAHARTVVEAHLLDIR